MGSDLSRRHVRASEQLRPPLFPAVLRSLPTLAAPAKQTSNSRSTPFSA